MIKIINARELTDADFYAPDETAASITESVTAIIAEVRRRGDNALREYTKRFDGCDLTSFEVTRDELDASLDAAGTEFIGVMRCAAENIERFHRQQVREGFTICPEPGVTLGQRILPLNRVGLYIPGGTAAYPSSVLMNCIPAMIAGVPEIVLVTPPRPDGTVDPGILAAAKLGGANRVYRLGGAQAIAALAYGTETIPKVDKIVGPGNAYVAEAKRQVFGAVGIDMIAGPSDITIIAGGYAHPVLIAADMLSQCEHGELSKAILVTDSPPLAELVRNEIETQLPALPREEIARAAVDGGSRIIVTDTLDEAFEVANRIAPEHLEIFLDDAMELLDKVRNAGSVFLGPNSPEALGDYYAGPNHTLPTSGTARFASPLSVDDFVKKSSFTCYCPEALVDAAADIVFFAEREGLYAHAESVLKRLELWKEENE